jgi:hypothetical protein
MSLSQGIEVRRPSRRTIASGAAWAVPVIAVGAAAPLASASPGCVPQFNVDPDESFKCCNGAIKNMKLRITITDLSNCVNDTTPVCIHSILPDTGSGSVANTVPDTPIGRFEDDAFTVFLLGVSNCTVNLVVEFSIGLEGDRQFAFINSDNIPSGNVDGQCLPTDPL